jgi:TRAP-type mannitol/chloroaromatic compound transport system substrate-binding protein
MRHISNTDAVDTVSVRAESGKAALPEEEDVMKRRSFVKGAAGAGLLAVGARSAVAQTKSISLRIESPVPPSSVLFENFKMYAERVDAMSGGRLKIQALPAGAVVPAFEILDAASRGVLDGGHYWVGYATGKGPAAALLAGAPAGTWGMDHLDYYGWIYEGGGLALFQEFYDQIKSNVVTVGPVAGVGPQMLGWFKKPIKDLAEFKRMKYRVPGIAADVYQELGVSVVSMAGGEIVAAGERGVLDGAEWLTPADDIKLGFHNVWKYMIAPAFHDYVPTWEIVVNKNVWAKIPPDLQEMMKDAATATTLRHWVRLNRQNAESLKELQKLGVTTAKTPPDINQAFLEAWKKVADRYAAKDAFFKKVLESQKRYANLVTSYRLAVPPPYEFAASYFNRT